MPPEGSPPERSGHKFAFILNGERYRTGDDTLDGRAIRLIAGLTPPSDYILVEVRRPGTSSVGLQDPVTLSQDAPAEFHAWKADRLFSFTLDEIGYEWGDKRITEAELRNVSGVEDDKDLILERTDQPDQVLGDGDLVALNPDGVEHLRTAEAATTIYINTEPFVVTGRKLTFEKLVGLAFNPVPSGPNIMITVDYGKGPKKKPKGSLEAGQSVKIVNGMTFDVTATDRS